MSDTHKHKKAWRQRQSGAMEPGFDGRRYGNKRKGVAVLKVKDRRRRNRRLRKDLEGFDAPNGCFRKHEME